MTVEVFTCCDFAQDNSGKLTVVGAFDSIQIRSLPAQHPFMSVAVKIRFQMHELGSHRVVVELRSPSGAPLVQPFDHELNLSNVGTDTTSTQLVLNHIGLRFEETGKHELRLSIDGDTRAVAPLYVRQLPAH